MGDNLYQPNTSNRQTNPETDELKDTADRRIDEQGCQEHEVYRERNILAGKLTNSETNVGRETETPIELDRQTIQKMKLRELEKDS